MKEDSVALKNRKLELTLTNHNSCGMNFRKAELSEDGEILAVCIESASLEDDDNLMFTLFKESYED